MPVVQPQNWPYNPWVFNKAEELWNKLPSDVRNNLKSISDAPTPGLPIGAADDIIAGGIKGAVAIPAMLANPKTRTYLKNMMGGLDLGEAVPAVRNQQENFPFPFTQWIKDRIPRSALFFSPGGHKFSYDEMAEGAAEGGPHKVEWLQKLKNPLVIKRDETGFLAEHVIRTLLGSETVPTAVTRDVPAKYISVPNKEGQEILRSIGRAVHSQDSRKQEAINNILKYIEPKQLESALSARDPKTALGEAIASELARKAGYDSIISTRPKTVISTSQKMANETSIKNLRKYQKVRSKLGSSEFMYPSGTSKEDLKELIDPWVATPAKDRLFRKLGITRGQFNGKIARDIYKRIENYPITRPELARVSDFADTLIEKVAKRGAKTELLPTQVMLIDKPWLKGMREKGKDYLNTPPGGSLPFNPSTMSQMAKDIFKLHQNNGAPAELLSQAIDSHLTMGNLSKAEANYLSQYINGVFQ